MNRDHRGYVYGIATDDEERFDFLVNAIKEAQRNEDTNMILVLTEQLESEFSSDLRITDEAELTRLFE